MAEANLNAEMARHLDEHGGRGRSPHERAIEIAEAVLLAVVAVLTAWSGYQAALWDGESARAYATSARERIEAEQLYLRSGQTLAYNAGTFNAWLQATVQEQEDLATVLEGRFTPEYKEAFDAWLELDPLNDPGAPAGPATRTRSSSSRPSSPSRRRSRSRRPSTRGRRAMTSCARR